MSEGKAQRRPYPNNLKYVIHLHGYKVVEVADELQIPHSTLYDYVSGYRPAPKECLKSIAQLLGCDVNEFRYDQPARASHASLDTTETHLSFQSLRNEPHTAAREKEHHAPVLALPVQTRIPVTDADYAAWFGKKLAYIVTMITHSPWQGRDYCNLQAWVDKEIHMFDEIKPLWASDGYSLSRREAIIAIAALPMMLLTAAQNLPWSALVRQELLFRCSASIAACWHLTAGRDFEEIEQAITPYLSILTNWSQQTSEFQQQAADLAAQGYVLLGLAALHTQRSPRNLHQRLAYCQQAVMYGKLSGNPALYVATLEHLAGAFFYIGRYPDMLQSLQKTTQLLSEVSPLIQSKIYSDLARSSACNGQQQEALRYTEQARETLPASIDYVPVYLSADSGLFYLIWREGQTRLILGDHDPEGRHYEQAEKALTEVEKLEMFIPERLRMEMVNDHTLTFMKMGNLDQFCFYLKQGIQGAHALHSQQRLQEAMEMYRQARLRWPNETRITDLADLFVSMN